MFAYSQISEPKHHMSRSLFAGRAILSFRSATHLFVSVRSSSQACRLLHSPSEFNERSSLTKFSAERGRGGRRARGEAAARRLPRPAAKAPQLGSQAAPRPTRPLSGSFRSRGNPVSAESESDFASQYMKTKIHET